MSIASRGFWRDVRKHAWELTAKLFGGTTPWLVTVFVSALAVAGVGYFFGRDEAKVEILVALIVPLAVLGMVLTVNMVRAPRLVHEENLRSITQIEKERDQALEKLKGNIDRQRIADFLIGQADYGVQSIQNGYTGIRTGKSHEKWARFQEIVIKDDEWVRTTVERMKEMRCTKREMSEIEVIGDWDRVRLMHKDPQINERAVWSKVRIHRMRKIARKYDSS